jgi:hypothetical protein
LPDGALWLCVTGKEINAMNRHERRKAKALSRLGHKNNGPTVAAVHEAGHAVAKVLAIGELGYSIDDAIKYIDMGSNQAFGPSVDGQMMMYSQGVTFGPKFSKQIEEASREFKQAYLSEHEHGVLQGAETHEFLSKFVELGRAAGADIGKWFRARVFDAVTGSIAEAIVTKRTFNDVWNGYQAEGDVSGVMRDASISGIAVDEVKSTIKRTAALSAYLMEQPEVWAAVVALGNKLPIVGRMDGDKAVAIITKALSESGLRGMFADGLEGIADLERQISAAKVVFAKCADDSNHLIKGGELIKRIKDYGIGERVEHVQFQCTFRIFAETLCRAFGDGASQKS